MKGQKEAVIEAVKLMLPTFKPFHDIALIMLTEDQLESLKHQIGQDICSGKIEYGKDSTNAPEVFVYARSMVMNHLKKAKELNGNQVYGKSKATVEAEVQSKKLSNVNLDILPEGLKTYVKSLV